MKKISVASDVFEFAGLFVAVKVTLPSYFGSKEKFPIIGDDGLLFAYIEERASIWKGETSYRMAELLKEDAIDSNNALIDSKLSEVSMHMRLATPEELASIKTLIEIKEARFEMRNSIHTLHQIEDAISMLTRGITSEEFYRERLGPRRWLEAEHLAPKIDFKDCLESADGRMMCRPEVEPEVSSQFLIRYVSKYPSHSTQSWAEIGADSYPRCQTFPTGAIKKICRGEKTEYIEKYISLESETPDPIRTTLTTLGTAALRSAYYTALSEAVGDSLYLTGLLSKTNAERVKEASQLMLVYLSGSILSLGASWTVSRLLQKTGMSKQKAQYTGQAIAIGINAGVDLFTPTGLALTAVSMTASRFGFWAEKKAVSAITRTTEKKLSLT